MNMLFSALTVLSAEILIGSFLASPALAAKQETGAAVKVENAFVRLVPPAAPNTAAFMTIKNKSSKALHLISATSDLSDTVELHSHVKDGDMFKMVRVEKLAIPANGEAVLKPGGDHIMLMKIKRELNEKQTVEVTLTFDDQSQLKLNLPLRK